MTLAEAIEKIEDAARKGLSVAYINDDEITPSELPKNQRLPEIHIRFERIKFTGALILNHVVFPKGISFIDVDFNEKTTFVLAQFNGSAYFWKCRFHNEVDFYRASVLKLDHSSGRLLPGEANFSYSEFERKLTLKRCLFRGPAFFHRTVFLDNVDFHEARFEEGVTFDSMATDVCVAARELPSDAIPILEKNKLLLTSGFRTRGYYNFGPQIDSIADLQGQLSKRKDLLRPHVASGNPPLDIKLPEEPVINADQREQIVRTWERYSKLLMFSWGHRADFTGCFFGPSTRFQHLSLRSCRLCGTSLANVEFDDVTWDDRRLFLWANKLPLPWAARDKISDEIDVRKDIPWCPFRKRFKKGAWLRSKSSLLSISARYHELKVIYDKKGERQRARDFYYGEIEMARLAAPIWRRPFSLSLVYKWASGYGTREGKGAFILLMLVFALFPWSYHCLDVRSGTTSQRTTMKEVAHAELESLEASTVLIPSSGAGAQRTEPQRLIESLERVVVTLQGALFLFAVKSRFHNESD